MELSDHGIEEVDIELVQLDSPECSGDSDSDWDSDSDSDSELMEDDAEDRPQLRRGPTDDSFEGGGRVCERTVRVRVFGRSRAGAMVC